VANDGNFEDIMTRRRFSRFSRLSRLAAPLLLAASVATIAACAAVDPGAATIDSARRLSKGPRTTPFRSITSFSENLRCMDVLLADYGVRDQSVIAEDIGDPGARINAGTKDMMISAISDMTRRSRAFRVVTYGQDSGNTVGFLQEAQMRDPYTKVPRYAVRGSVSQVDDSIAAGSVTGGLTVGSRVGVSANRAATASVIGLDLAVVTTRDLSVVAGVTSRNSVLVVATTDGANATATIGKFGLDYSLTTARQEGPTQALRTLVELASIELFGRLAKVPYWSCLGASDADAAVQSEILDWYDAMAMSASQSELVAYFQGQLRTRRVYGGPIDGVASGEFNEAVVRYRELLQLAGEPKLSLEFFQAYLKADHRKLAEQITPVPLRPLAADGDGSEAGATNAKTQSAGPGRVVRIGGRVVDGGGAMPPALLQRIRAAVAIAEGDADEAPANTASGPLALHLEADGARAAWSRNAAIKLAATVDRDGHLYCYLRDNDNTIKRIFPNRYASDSSVHARHGQGLPGTDRIELVADDTGARQIVACYATEREVASELPAAAFGTDLEALQVRTLADVRSAFAAATHDHFAEERLPIEIR
jgi:curli biogenesis system outer membrane secretion channel CsgG